jgi:hypothetical protein
VKFSQIGASSKRFFARFRRPLKTARKPATASLRSGYNKVSQHWNRPNQAETGHSPQHTKFSDGAQQHPERRQKISNLRKNLSKIDICSEKIDPPDAAILRPFAAHVLIRKQQISIICCRPTSTT